MEARVSSMGEFTRGPLSANHSLVYWMYREPRHAYRNKFTKQIEKQGDNTVKTIFFAFLKGESVKSLSRNFYVRFREYESPVQTKV